MRDYKQELENRVNFIKAQLEIAKADGIVYGNSGGKDSALVGILCKKACDNTVGVIMPCTSKQNYKSDMEDAKILAGQFDIKTIEVDLTSTAAEIEKALCGVEITKAAKSNIAPRLRMTTLYAIASSENRLVAGTGNRSEGYMGYFTKWGDGAHDFNPIADLTVTEMYEFLTFLKAPESIINKPPSAGLFDGQTDENEMGITYKSIDAYLLTGQCSDSEKAIIDRFHNSTEHKRKMPVAYGDN